MLNYVYAHSGSVGRSFLNTAKKLKGDKKGVTALEYGILAATIASVVVVGATALGTNINSLFNTLATKVTNLPS